MKRLRSDVSYTFETIDRGARVRIVSANAEAIQAIHEFLRYQIKDHQTGDSLEPDKHAKWRWLTDLKSALYIEAGC